MYDLDFERVFWWAIVMLTCLVHLENDGLRAHPEGEVHGVIVPVPVSAMEKAGTYRFVLHFYDDYADSYKNHQVKAALEKNITKSMKVFHIEDDWMVTPDGKSLNPLARSLEVKSAFRKADWIVHTAGSKCKGKICVLSGVCTKVPYRETLPTERDRSDYSSEYFFYYNERHRSRYVHVIRAAYCTGPNDIIYGMSSESQRYAYIFVQLIHGSGATGKDLDYLIKQTTIHELGHQFGIDDHPAENPVKTRKGKFCPMWASAPSILIDLEFCDECVKRIRDYKGW